MAHPLSYAFAMSSIQDGDYDVKIIDFLKLIARLDTDHTIRYREISNSSRSTFRTDSAKIRAVMPQLSADQVVQLQNANTCNATNWLYCGVDNDGDVQFLDNSHAYGSTGNYEEIMSLLKSKLGTMPVVGTKKSPKVLQQQKLHFEYKGDDGEVVHYHVSGVTSVNVSADSVTYTATRAKANGQITTSETVTVKYTDLLYITHVGPNKATEKYVIEDGTIVEKRTIYDRAKFA